MRIATFLTTVLLASPAAAQVCYVGTGVTQASPADCATLNAGYRYLSFLHSGEGAGRDVRACAAEVGRRAGADADAAIPACAAMYLSGMRDRYGR